MVGTGRLRGGGVYLTVVLLLRLSGRRELGQLTPFDFVLLMLISEAASNALTAGDESWAAAVIAITTMLLLNTGLGLLTTRYTRIEHLMAGRPALSRARRPRALRRAAARIDFQQ